MTIPYENAALNLLDQAPLDADQWAALEKIARDARLALLFAEMVGISGDALAAVRVIDAED